MLIWSWIVALWMYGKLDDRLIVAFKYIFVVVIWLRWSLYYILIIRYTASSELLPLLAVGTTPVAKVERICQAIKTSIGTIENSVTISSPFATFSFSADASFEVRTPSRIQVLLNPCYKHDRMFVSSSSFNYHRQLPRWFIGKGRNNYTLVWKPGSSFLGGYAIDDKWRVRTKCNNWNSTGKIRYCSGKSGTIWVK